MNQFDIRREKILEGWGDRLDVLRFLLDSLDNEERQANEEYEYQELTAKDITHE